MQTTIEFKTNNNEEFFISSLSALGKFCQRYFCAKKSQAAKAAWLSKSSFTLFIFLCFIAAFILAKETIIPSFKAIEDVLYADFK